MGSCGLRHGCGRKPSRTRTGAGRGIGVVDNHSFGSVSSLFKTGHLVGFGSLGRGRLPIVAGQAVFQPEGARQIRNGKPGLVLLFVSGTARVEGFGHLGAGKAAGFHRSRELINGRLIFAVGEGLEAGIIGLPCRGGGLLLLIGLLRFFRCLGGLRRLLWGGLSLCELRRWRASKSKHM